MQTYTSVVDMNSEEMCIFYHEGSMQETAFQIREYIFLRQGLCAFF